jgi:hypothetical protein
MKFSWKRRIRKSFYYIFPSPSPSASPYFYRTPAFPKPKITPAPSK